MTEAPSAAPSPADIEFAASRIKGAIVRTDCDPSRTLSDMTGADVFLKFENLQFTASFKDRGALNKLLSLTKDEARNGVICMSAGNHAQGVAYHAQRLGLKSTVFMPVGTPEVKINNTRRFGAEVLVEGESLEDAAGRARAYGAKRGLTFIHPYDDASVIAGQGTIGFEMLEEIPKLDALLVPIGGGGLISGIAIAVKARRPEVEIIGVQARLYPSMFNAIKGTSLPMRGDTLAEGIAVKAPGVITTPVVRRYVDDILLVDEPEIERALTILIEIEKTVVEGAGACSLAALMNSGERFRGRRVGLVLSGGNIDTRLLAGVLTRELAREGRLSELRVDLADRPGQLGKLAQVLGEMGANIIEVVHGRVFTDLPAKATEARVVIETRDFAHLAATVKAIEAAGFRVTLPAMPGGGRHSGA